MRSERLGDEVGGGIRESWAMEQRETLCGPGISAVRSKQKEGFSRKSYAELYCQNEGQKALSVASLCFSIASSASAFN